MKFPLFICIFLIPFHNVQPFFESIFVGMASYILNDQNRLTCFMQECCVAKSDWMPMDIGKLENTLSSLLHGQHLVQFVVAHNLKYHISNPSPKRALLLSFNGMTGTGKNFVSQMIANSFYHKGFKSDYVHLFMSSVDFPSSKNTEIEKYKKNIQQKIIETVKRCPHSLFIFDEVQDMPEGLLDVIKPFVDIHEVVKGIDFRQSIFILLSNTGGDEINMSYIKVWTSGRQRESITLKEMEDVLTHSLYYMKSDGLRKSKLIAHHLVTAFVPFVPLEKRHVKLCIRDYLREKNYRDDDPEVINKVIDSMNFTNVSGLELSIQGCKRIPDKTDVFL